MGFVSSCSTDKTIVKTPTYLTGELLLGEVFLQDEVPGLQGEKIRTYLNVHFENSLEEIESLKISWNDSSYVVNKLNNRLRICVRMDENRLRKEAIENKIKIIYKKRDMLHLQEVADIIIKEPLYLP